MRADVGHEVDLDTIRRDSRQVLESSVVLGEFLLLLDLLVVAGNVFRCRIDDDLAALAVHDDVVAIRDAVDAVFLVEADDRRDRASLGDDDGMGRRAARAEQDAGDLLRLHAGDDGRLNLTAAEDDLLVTDLRLLDAEDVLGDALADIAQVNSAGCKVLVLHLLEHDGLLFRSLEDALRRIAELVDLGHDVVGHHRILYHHAMCFHDGSLFLHVLALELLDALAQDLCHSRQRILCLLLLRLLVFRFVIDEIAIEILTCEHDLAHGNTGDDAFTTNDFCHFSFPLKIPCIRVHSLHIRK